MGSSVSMKKRGIKANMMLIGAPSVGKSTVFRQMKLLYRDGFTEEERIRARIELRRNLIASLLKLDQVALNEGLNLSSNDAEEAITKLKHILPDYQFDEREDANCVEAEGEAEIKKIQNLEEDLPPYPSEEAAIAFQDPNLQTVKEKILHPQYEVPENDPTTRELIVTAMPYVFKHFDRINKPDFLPTDQDCLHLRRHTTSVEKIAFNCAVEIRDKKEIMECTCIDIGGQAQEQDKWEQHAKNIDFVLFVASLADFARVLPNGDNALQEQFNLLAKLFAAPCFEQANMVVLLNKSDILKAKLKYKTLTDFFPDFKGDNTVSAATAFFEARCKSLLKKVEREQSQLLKRKVEQDVKQIRVVPTCALDTKMVDKVLVNAFQASLTANLLSSGLPIE